jgi:hypothetical protein
MPGTDIDVIIIVTQRKRNTEPTSENIRRAITIRKQGKGEVAFPGGNIITY